MQDFRDEPTSLSWFAKFRHQAHESPSKNGSFFGLQQCNAGRAGAFKEHSHKKKERLHKSRRSAVTFQSQPAAAAGVFRCFVTSPPPSFPLSKRRPQHHISQTKRPGLDFCKVGGWQTHFFTLKCFTAPHSHSPQAKLCSAKQELTLFSDKKSFCRKVDHFQYPLYFYAGSSWQGKGFWLSDDWATFIPFLHLSKLYHTKNNIA